MKLILYIVAVVDMGSSSSMYIVNFDIIVLIRGELVYPLAVFAVSLVFSPRG